MQGKVRGEEKREKEGGRERHGVGTHTTKRKETEVAAAVVSASLRPTRFLLSFFCNYASAGQT